MLTNSLSERKSLDLQWLLLSKGQIFPPWSISSYLWFDNQPPCKIPAYLTITSWVGFQTWAHHWKNKKSLSPKRAKQSCPILSYILWEVQWSTLVYNPLRALAFDIAPQRHARNSALFFFPPQNNTLTAFINIGFVLKIWSSLAGRQIT